MENQRFSNIFEPDYEKPLNFPFFSNYFQYFPICLRFFQFSNYFKVLGEGGGALPAPSPPRSSKLLHDPYNQEIISFLKEILGFPRGGWTVKKS